MSKRKAGYFWHVHHEILVEYSEDIDERIEYIKNNKPLKEINIRLKLLRKVKGVLPKVYRDAYKVYRDAYKVYRDADKANWDTYKVYRDTYYKTCQDVDKARQDAYKVYRDEIEALHKKECPNCPWNGNTIFTKV